MHFNWRIVLWFLWNIQGLCKGLLIHQLTVPKAVKANSSEVILDCNYNVEEWEKSNGFVLKWYINNVNLVYQWIPPRDPTILGSLRGRLDPTYRASEDQWSEHRALRIIRPDPSLSGTYTCIVATFDTEDADEAKLLIWAPPSDVRLKYWRPSAMLVRVDCSAVDVSPKPIFSLYKRDPDGTRHEIAIRDRDDQQGSRGGLLTSRVWGTVIYEKTKKETVIGCTVSVRGKMFKETRETVYHSDLPIITTTTSTTAKPEEEAIKAPSIASFAISSQRPNKEFGPGMNLLLFIVFLSRQCGIRTSFVVFAICSLF